MKLREYYFDEIDELIKNGESLSANGVTYEDYRLYGCLRGNSADPYGYEFLCYEGKSREYFAVQARDIFDRWVEGEEFPDHELARCLQYDPVYWEKAQVRKEMNQYSGLLRQALEENGIRLGSNESFEMKLSGNNRLLVSGIEDPIKSKMIEDIVNDLPIKLLFQKYNNLPNSNEHEAVLDKHNGKAISVASNLSVAEKFLGEYGATINDIYFDKKGNVCGKLPQELLDKMNNARIFVEGGDYDTTSEEYNMFCRKRVLQIAVNNVAKYGYDNFPVVNFHFSYKDGKIEVVDEYKAHNLYG